MTNNANTPASGQKRGLNSVAWQRLLPVLFPATILIVLGIVWEFAHRAGALPITVPSPAQISKAALEDGPLLWHHARPTLLIALGAYVIAAAIVSFFSAMATLFRQAEGTVLGVGLAIDSIPIIALTPIVMIWMGSGVGSKLTIATVPALFPLLVGAIQGLKAVDRGGAELFHVLSASPWQRFRKLALPSALPFIFSGLKIAAPLAILGALIAEWAGADRGLGVMMIYAMFAFNVPQLWLAILATCATAVIAYGCVALAERLIVNWDTGGTLTDEIDT